MIYEIKDISETKKTPHTNDNFRIFLDGVWVMSCKSMSETSAAIEAHKARLAKGMKS